MSLLEILGTIGTIEVMDIGASCIAEVPVYKVLLDDGLAHLNAFEGDPRQIEEIKWAFGGRVTIFNDFVGRVLALLDEKDRMLGAIGHDLRTPLASLRIRIESMEPDDEREASIAKIAEINAMLEDILILARSGRAREEARPVDLAALAEALVEECRALGEPVEFMSSGRSVAEVQPALLRRALRNLIDNAVKYGGSARVSAATANDEIRLQVDDDGPGIPPDEIERSLQPFYRLEASRNRETGGSGLGLAIARSIAESHGGRLELRGRKPQGLSASIILPAPGTAR
jgi:signal transduction histidine kinase